MAFGVGIQEILSVFILHNNPENFLSNIRICGPWRTIENRNIIILARRGKKREHAKDYSVYPISKIMFHKAILKW